MVPGTGEVQLIIMVHRTVRGVEVPGVIGDKEAETARDVVYGDPAAVGTDGGGDQREPGIAADGFLLRAAHGCKGVLLRKAPAQCWQGKVLPACMTRQQVEIS